MRAESFAAVAFAAFILVASGEAVACTAAGPNKHVGVVLGIDEKAQSFTVLDAQMNQPITFLAEEGILASLKDVKGQVLVDFEPEGSKLRATNVQY